MKRIFPVLLSLVLVFSLIAVSAQADEVYFFDASSSSDSIFPFYVPDGTYCAVLSFDGYSFSSSGSSTLEYMTEAGSTVGLLSFSFPVEGDSGDYTFALTPIRSDGKEIDSVSLFIAHGSGSFSPFCDELGDVSLQLISSSSDNYFFVPSDVGAFCVSSRPFPEGLYKLTVYYSFDDGFNICLGSSSPVSVSYEPYTIEESSVELSVSSCHLTVLEQNLPHFQTTEIDGFDFLVFRESPESVSMCVLSDSEENVLFEDMQIHSSCFILEPVQSSSPATPSLSGIVDSNMMSGVLDQVVDLLPIVVGLIVGFIGLRKAISWLQGILHSA